MNPNYLYTWVRDSSLVFKTIIDQFTTGADTSLRSLIDLFVTAESNLQSVSNPSGSITTGGLGPTEDDLTKEMVGEFFGLPMELDEKSLEAVRARMCRLTPSCPATEKQ